MTEQIMDRLRTSTAQLHVDAEGHRFQNLLGIGRVPQDQYALYLQQLYLMHQKLAQLLSADNIAGLHFADVLKAHHFDLSAITGDLGRFSIDPGKAVALSATAKFLSYLEQLAKTNPVSLLGPLYVLEGSSNGAKFMAVKLKEGLQLNGPGADYFDRYGDKQKEYWLGFKSDMNAHKFDEHEEENIIAAAKATFQVFFDIGSEIDAL